ncbi:hypothetical protein [Novosphingobium sp. PY1]|uniref:hypothetical protein n=1 Tax=Novosphingobium sp. PY1 TaxID=1882221 RepID=UPI001F5CEA82|nr:hypothetical protein [Novosphingobium sp. PY1]
MPEYGAARRHAFQRIIGHRSNAICAAVKAVDAPASGEFRKLASEHTSVAQQPREDHEDFRFGIYIRIHEFSPIRIFFDALERNPQSVLEKPIPNSGSQECGQEGRGGRRK